VVANSGRIYVGCATWAIGEANERLLPPGRSNLERYSRRLTAAEVNSSFHRTHREATWARWAASVGPSFRFSVKVPKTVTHEHRLVGAESRLAAFLAEIRPLGPKLGPLLLQLPPSLQWNEPVVAAFLNFVTDCHLVVEPRHASWFTDEVDAFFAERQIARVAADPAVVPRAAEPGGWNGLRYYRLHGSPVTYRSSYSDDYLDKLGARLEPGDWCIFDNTASGAALPNALELLSRVRPR
jgi:uncharacterized protein YecE (DUF72 family)